MSKIRRIFNYSTLFVFCQVLAFLPLFFATPKASALSEAQSGAIIANCPTIKDTLKTVQKADSRARVYLGGYYETIISKFITPLNVRLVENNLSTAHLVENQNNFISGKANFVNDFVDYQRELETLINIDCATEPENFYTELGKVRERRAKVAKDASSLRNLLDFHITTITVIEEAQ